MRICLFLLICAAAEAGYCPLAVQYQRAGQSYVNHGQACCIQADADWVHFVTAIHPFVGTSGTPIVQLKIRGTWTAAELRWTSVQHDLAIVRCRAFATPSVFLPCLPDPREPLQIWNQHYATLPARFYRPRLCYGRVASGDSGGPIVTRNGKLVGVILASTEIEESACVGGQCFVFGAQLQQRRRVPGVEYADATDIQATWQAYRAYAERNQTSVQPAEPSPYQRTQPAVIASPPVLPDRQTVEPKQPAPADVRPPRDDPVSTETVPPTPAAAASPALPVSPSTVSESEGWSFWKLWPWLAVAGVAIGTGGIGVPWALKAWSAISTAKTVASTARETIARAKRWRGRPSGPSPPNRPAAVPPVIHQQVVEVEKDTWRRAILYGMRNSAMKYPDRVGVLNYLEQQVNQYMGQQLVQHPDEAWSSS